MAKDFRRYKARADYNTIVLEKGSATVIRPGTFVTLDAGSLCIEATDTSTSMAYTETGAIAGETSVIVTNDVNVTFTGTADAVFAKANRGTTVDLVINSGVQEIDLGASLTNVLKILPSEDAGTVGSASDVVVRINAPLF